MKFQKPKLVKWLLRPFKDRWYLLVHQDPIHKGVYWRIYRKVFSLIPLYSYFLKAQSIDAYGRRHGENAWNPRTFIYDGSGAKYVVVMGSGNWEIGPPQGDDCTNSKFRTDTKEMTTTEITEERAEEILFTEAL